MKHLKLAMICLSLTLTVMVVSEAEAGRFNKPSKGERTEKTEEEMIPRRFDNLPTMSFMSGILTRDAHSGWKIGETPLYLHGECVITMDGSDEGMLQEGAKAIVMGARMGGAVSAWAIHVSMPQYGMAGFNKSAERKEVGPNSNVGMILEPKE